MRRKACYALAPVLSRAGADVLARIAGADAKSQADDALHALSLAAKKRIKDAAAAAEFAATLPG